MQVPTEILLVIFVAVAAVALLGQWLVFLGIARRLNALSQSVAPLLPPLEQGTRALPGLVRDLQSLVNDTRPQLQKASANLLEISTLARGQAERFDHFAGDLAERLELQMVRVDEAMGTALGSVEQVTTAVRETVLRPVRDVTAVVEGVRTGLDFFFRRRSSPPSTPVYQDEEMFI